ncbi:CDP-diacylglycerol--glycerol-3-phosphate 3-phosphatidyltransferase [Blastopirellula sp. JC732]|uniref:CDP-diacylglycerol--glycerol-3-phosphate 3-phosphatidyltransferase n=1 Tax=Blastopirellula sediminis TaxID=2894196 RepID=A0A9X1SHP4_9BACT|nr:CDP-diacylglycerol--glycerol-3-phosphate 3-phosphatidyltransferase [Blastopirellula sediminis]MCC9607833.1 CDP-diacylglycerol--glycerol-3-phosphate 3-phosphatidyltransferase [Blastopirellula sediminis]MCC9627374.1 CDP-diacylglycerol--glycerol-3-phosphate 3-phosphatidyltransferase [Blastopirellula sediminis]
MTTADAKPTASTKIVNVPNVITMIRFVLSIAVFVLLSLEQFIAANVVFILAASTDWMDGYWARKYNEVTQVGRVFDPFVDKIIICGTFIYLATLSGSEIAAWMAVVVVGREMLVTVLRSFIEGHGGDFSANMPGKIKMVLQCVAAVASMTLLAYLQVAADGPYAAALQWTTIISAWAAVASTVHSGVIYIFAAARMIRDQAIST